MTNGKRKIALIYGGRGCEHSVSLASAKYVRGLISKEKYDLLNVFIDKTGVWWLTDEASNDSAKAQRAGGKASLNNADALRVGDEASNDSAASRGGGEALHNNAVARLDRKGGNSTKLESSELGSRGTEVFPIRMGGASGLFDGETTIPVDCAIPLLHGDFGEDGRIQGALDTAGIPFIGASTVAGALCIDKAFTKAVARELGIPVARGKSLPCGAKYGDALLAAKEIGFPVFVKPRRLGSSVGAGIARDGGELKEAFARAEPYGEIMLEELIEQKRELEIGLLSLKDGLIISPVGEVVCGGFYDFDKKYGSQTETRTRADISLSVAEKIREYAQGLARAISLFGPMRIDFFLCGERLIFNEINTMPGFTADSLYPALMREAGIEGEALFDLLIGDALGE